MPDTRPRINLSRVVIAIMIFTFFLVIFLQITSRHQVNRTNSLEPEEIAAGMQEIEAEHQEVMAYDSVEIKPEMIGGAEALYKYIHDHELFPETAQRRGINGQCVVRFVVDETGTPCEFYIEKEEPEGFGFGESAQKAIDAMKFIPAEHSGRKVKVIMLQIIKFEMI
jgi:protein TonB